MLESATLLERAKEVCHSDVREGYMLARQALRLTDLQCLKIRAMVMMATCKSELSEIERAGELFGLAYLFADGCKCCGPVIDRNFAEYLQRTGEHDEAILTATRAVETSSERQRPVALLLRAYILTKTDRPGDAVDDLLEALKDLSPETAHHSVALFNLTDALTVSKTEKNLALAFDFLPVLHDIFKGLPGISRQRAHLAWLEAVICIALAEYRPADTRSLRKTAFPLFTTACRGFHALGLADLHAAVWADRGAALALGEPLKFSYRIAHRSKNPQRITPPPFTERYVELAAPIIAGNPFPLLSLRNATKQGVPLLRYPQKVDTQAAPAPLPGKG
jgi:hypothetical protein